MLSQNENTFFHFENNFLFWHTLLSFPIPVPTKALTFVYGIRYEISKESDVELLKHSTVRKS